MENSGNSGIGIGGTLTVLFVALKLTGYINWSWWWVLSPTLIPLALVIVFLVGLGITFFTINKN